MKILLIEDDIEISEMLCSYLIAENFEVVCATDGQKACEAFDIGSYSIVLLDLMIPKITGMNVMKYIDIVDRGRGIEKEFADSVFDRLFMMEDSRNSAMQGNGLGLTIAKNLALQLGGDITLESQPHQKTVFTITLKKMAY